MPANSKSPDSPQSAASAGNDVTGKRRNASTSPSPPEPSSKKAKVDADDLLDNFDQGDLDAEALIAAAEAAEGSQSSATGPSSTTTTKPAAQSSASEATSKPFTTPVPQSTTADDDPLALERRTMDPHWFTLLEPAMKTPTFKSLKSFLSSEKAARATIYPPEHLIHSWSRSCPLDKVKVVIIGQDPYHGPNQAHGMSFSVPKGVPVPASLKNIYKELGAEFGAGGFRQPTHGNLEGWANQGVLLLNACLTVRAHQAASHHGKGWEPFTIEILKLIAKRAKEAKAGTKSTSSNGAGGSSLPAANGTLTAMFSKQKKKQGQEDQASNKPTSSRETKQDATKAEEEPQSVSTSASQTQTQQGGIVFLSWGLPAQKTLAAAGITSSTPNTLILQSAHPSPLSAHRGFLGNGHFKKANEWLQGAGGWGQAGGIDWGRL